MRTRTDTIVLRLGFTLAVLVLGAFLALIGAAVLAGGVIVGGPAGWAAGVVLALVVAQATRRRCGALIARLVAVGLAQLRPAASSCWYFSVMWATASFCCSARPGRVSAARAFGVERRLRLALEQRHHVPGDQLVAAVRGRGVGPLVGQQQVGAEAAVRLLRQPLDLRRRVVGACRSRRSPTSLTKSIISRDVAAARPPSAGTRRPVWK